MTNSSYYDAWRAQTIQYLGGVCVICGIAEDLEFDHINEENKSFNLATNWSIADKEKLRNEVDKCQLLCKTHHAEKTKAYMRQLGLQQGITHGLTYAWLKKRCDCEICTAAKKAYRKNWNEKNRISHTPRIYPKHGISGYRKGCKCAICKSAHNKAVRIWRKRKQDQSN